MMAEFTHFNANGEVQMVDVGDKPVTVREAIAEGWIAMRAETLSLIINGGFRKGDVLAVARIAAIMAAKKTADLIPLCHPLPLTAVDIELIPLIEKNQVYCRTKIKTSGQTGVEMEALMATQMALLTIYDMCKSVDKGMIIEKVQLVEKSGGVSGQWLRESTQSL
ncbi:MAG: cyclic pyranopterin monophosphate synthase accessory protein [Pseudomonadota bacterium]